MLKRLSWKRLALELIFFCLPALLIGIFVGYLPWCLLISVLTALTWNFYNQLRLSDWLWLDRSMTPPRGYGNWELLFYGLHQMQLRNRKRRRELALLIKRFRSGAGSLPDAVVIITVDGHILWCNQLAQQLLEFRWPEDNGQHILNLLRYPEFNDYISQQEFLWPLTLQLNNGHHVEFRVMPYSAGQWLLVARDVTQMIQLESTRRIFFANVNHELRTPLTVLQGYLEMMHDQPLERVIQNKILVTMQEQTKRMDVLVKQLLMLSRIEVAPTTINMNEVVDVPIILQELQYEIAAINTATNNRNHQITFHVDPQLKILGNKDQLSSAISNLVYNAIKHTPTGTKIEIHWQLTPEGAQFQIKDNGRGIAAEHLPRLTERFYRVDDARSRETGGNGLGLAIVKHTLNHHDSYLDIVSKIGIGTNFSFILPQRLILTSNTDDIGKKFIEGISP